MITSLPLTTLAFIALGGFYAGAQNALAGGGSFITFPTLMLAGLSPLSANITSTIALFPSQIASCFVGRKLVGGVGDLSFRMLMSISVLGGILGACLLLYTPPEFFARLVPWLVLFATSVFAWGSFRKKKIGTTSALPTRLVGAIQLCISIYGGYFGGGIGFLMLAALTVAGQSVKMATATKNALAVAMNFAAVLIFAFSAHVHWGAVAAQGAGGILGGFVGGYLMHRAPEKVLRAFVVGVGIVLTVWLFARRGG